MKSEHNMWRVVVNSGKIMGESGELLCSWGSLVTV